MPEGAAQSELRCDACAGQRVYDPSRQALACSQCGKAEILAAADDHLAEAERAYDPSADEPMLLRTEAHRCETCGGEVVFTGPALSERCAYCDGPVVRQIGEEGYETMALIPFRVPLADAQKKALEWVGERLAAPGDLIDEVAKSRVAGLYAPFWTFDSEEAVAYWATYKVRRGKRTETRSTSGSLRMTFDDLLVPASPHVTPLIRDGILHEFDPRRLRPYLPGYLAGFAAERHHQTVRDGLNAAKADKDLLIRNRIKSHIGKSGVRVTRYKTDTTGIRYRRVLLPVWMLHYRYGEKPMKVVVCGMQGRTFGERPFSRLKLFAFSALLSAAAIGVGLAWGALGLP